MRSIWFVLRSWLACLILSPFVIYGYMWLLNSLGGNDSDGLWKFVGMGAAFGSALSAPAFILLAAMTYLMNKTTLSIASQKAVLVSSLIVITFATLYIYLGGMDNFLEPIALSIALPYLITGVCALLSYKMDQTGPSSD